MGELQANLTNRNLEIKKKKKTVTWYTFITILLDLQVSLLKVSYYLVYY